MNAYVSQIIEVCGHGTTRLLDAEPGKTVFDF